MTVGMMPGRAIFVIGAPGAGKDTNGDSLFQLNTELHKLVSMSGLIEYALEMGTIPGYSKADKSKGRLLEDVQCNELVRQALNQLPNDGVTIVTGFPRTEDQAEFAVEYCFERQWSVTFLILYITEDVALERIRRRREDMERRGSAREDDTDEVALDRFRLQSEHLHAMEPLLRSLPAYVLPVDASPKPEKVFEAILNLLRATERELKEA